MTTTATMPIMVGVESAAEGVGWGEEGLDDEAETEGAADGEGEASGVNEAEGEVTGADKPPSAYILWSHEPMYTTPPTTAGEELMALSVG